MGTRIKLGMLSHRMYHLECDTLSCICADSKVFHKEKWQVQ